MEKKRVDAPLLKKILLEAKTDSLLVMEEVAPPLIATWITLLAQTGDTQAAILLSVILPCVAALMGKTTVKTRDKLKNEVS